MNQVFINASSASIMSDVDFIVEIIEYKNACIAQAVKPSAFDPMSQKKKNSIAYKFYDTRIYLSATHHKNLSNMCMCLNILAVIKSHVRCSETRSAISCHSSYRICPRSKKS